MYCTCVVCSAVIMVIDMIGEVLPQTLAAKAATMMRTLS